MVGFWQYLQGRPCFKATWVEFASIAIAEAPWRSTFRIEGKIIDDVTKSDLLYLPSTGARIVDISQVYLGLGVLKTR
jgi:hypothetical protein